WSSDVCSSDLPLSSRDDQAPSIVIASDQAHAIRHNSESLSEFTRVRNDSLLLNVASLHRSFLLQSLGQQEVEA
ncbi:MAG: hypothetical protein AB8G99_24710, partial [Planctomycetaceae bacterium]